MKGFKSVLKAQRGDEIVYGSYEKISNKIGYSIVSLQQGICNGKCMFNGWFIKVIERYYQVIVDGEEIGKMTKPELVKWLAKNEYDLCAKQKSVEVQSLW